MPNIIPADKSIELHNAIICFMNTGRTILVSKEIERNYIFAKSDLTRKGVFDYKYFVYYIYLEYAGEKVC